MPDRILIVVKPTSGHDLELAVLADRQASRAALLVPILNNIAAHPGLALHPQAESGDFFIEDQLVGGFRLHAFDKPLRQFRHSSPRSDGRWPLTYWKR